MTVDKAPAALRTYTMDITPYYIDARNSITQPDKMVFLSQYFRRCWMPALGPLGTAIVIYLRGACYHNRRSGETRDTVQVAQREIAAGCGSSIPTIKREFERNEALRRFVQVSPEWERDGANGRVRQLENHYKVAMDDPLTEADEAGLKRTVEERIAREREAQEPPGGTRRKSIRVKGLEENGSTACSTAVLDSVRDACSNAVNLRRKEADLPSVSPRDQNELLRPGAHFESTPIQNELLSEESLLKTTKEQTLNVREQVNFVEGRGKTVVPVPEPPKRRHVFEGARSAEAAMIAEELRDWGSERRHKQLLAVCEQYGLSHLPGEALEATRRRLGKETSRGLLEKPGAYYQRVLVSLLEGHQVFVPTAGEDDPEEVRRLVRQSLKPEEDP